MKRLLIYSNVVMTVMRANAVDDVQLRAMESAIMRGEGATLAHTGGIKKIRCAAGTRGKSGSVRVLFADYPAAGRTYLLAAFGKNERANLTRAEANELAAFKKKLDKMVERLIQNAKQN